MTGCIRTVQTLTVPMLNRKVVRGWLWDNDRSVKWLAEQAGMPAKVLANALTPKADRIREGRVRAISRVTGIPRGQLTADEKKNGGEQEGPKEETTAPPRRTDKSGSGPRRATDQVSAA